MNSWIGKEEDGVLFGIVLKTICLFVKRERNWLLIWIIKELVFFVFVLCDYILIVIVMVMVPVVKVTEMNERWMKIKKKKKLLNR